MAPTNSQAKAKEQVQAVAMATAMMKTRAKEGLKPKREEQTES